MKLAEKTEARQLRGNGLSIKQIAELLSVSKGSVSNWVRDINLTQCVQANIKNRIQLGREHARLSRLNNIASKRNKLFQRCKKDIVPVSRRDLWIAGLMLYAGEGRKVWDASSQAIELTSSEPDIIRVFINFLTLVCGIKRNKIKIRLFLFPDIDVKETESFWAQ